MMAEKKKDSSSKLKDSLKLIMSIFGGKGPVGGFSGTVNEKIKKAGKGAANKEVRKRFNK